MAKKVSIAARINNELADQLKDYAKTKGLSYTEVIEQSLAYLLECNTECNTNTEDVIQTFDSVKQSDISENIADAIKKEHELETENAVLKERCESLSKQLEKADKQLDTKDAQISELNKALLNAQEQGKGAQVLQAAEKQEKLLTAEVETVQEIEVQKPTRWQYFKAVFTGNTE